MATLIELMGQSTGVFADVLALAVNRLSGEAPAPGGDHVPLRAGVGGGGGAAGRAGDGGRGPGAPGAARAARATSARRRSTRCCWRARCEWGEALSARAGDRRRDDEGLADAVRRVFADAWRRRCRDASWSGPCCRAGAPRTPTPSSTIWPPAARRPWRRCSTAGSICWPWRASSRRCSPCPAEAWDSPDVIGLVLAPINEARCARRAWCAPSARCAGPADVRAALADPLLDDELRALWPAERRQPLTESSSCSRSWAASSTALWRHSLAR